MAHKIVKINTSIEPGDYVRCHTYAMAQDVGGGKFAQLAGYSMRGLWANYVNGLVVDIEEIDGMQQYKIREHCEGPAKFFHVPVNGTPIENSRCGMIYAAVVKVRKWY